MLFSQIIPPSPSPTESKSLFFTSVSLLLSCIQGHHYHLSKFHKYALIYCIGVFLTYFTLYNRLVSSTPLELTQMCSFLQLSNTALCICTTTFLSISLPKTSRLLPCPSYCKHCCDEHWDTCVSFNCGFLGVYAQQ